MRLGVDGELHAMPMEIVVPGAVGIRCTTSQRLTWSSVRAQLV
jgi:hypothetical protein